MPLDASDSTFQAAPNPVQDEEAREAVRLLNRLSDDVEASISELMVNQGISYAEAVLALGIVTQEELDDALARLRQGPPRQAGGLIEGMLANKQQRKAQPSQQQWPIVPHKGPTLQPGKQLVIAHDSDHPRSEQLRRLRTELMLRTNSRRGAAFYALVSPSAREGRSQLAAELAISFAQLNRKTLLVDADMRRPSQHELFGADNRAGLAQALAGGGAINLRSVQDLPRLSVLTSGGQPPNPVELLHGPRFERMISEWRRTYEFILLDTPPMSEFTDAVTIAAAAGNVIVLGRAPTTTFNSLKEMQRHLEPVQARVVGAVINSF